MREKTTTLYDVKNKTNNFFTGIDKNRRKVINSKIAELNREKHTGLFFTGIGILCGASVAGVGYLSREFTNWENIHYIVGAAMAAVSPLATFYIPDSKRKAEIKKELADLKQQRAKINSLIALNKKPDKTLKKYRVQKRNIAVKRNCDFKRM